MANGIYRLVSSREIMPTHSYLVYRLPLFLLSCLPLGDKLHGICLGNYLRSKIEKIWTLHTDRLVITGTVGYAFTIVCILFKFSTKLLFMGIYNIIWRNKEQTTLALLLSIRLFPIFSFSFSFRFRLFLRPGQFLTDERRNQLYSSWNQSRVSREVPSWYIVYLI